VEIHLLWGLPSKSHSLSFSGFAYHGLKNSMYISATCLCLPIQIAVFFQLQSVIGGHVDVSLVGMCRRCQAIYTF
jgi:hypothetical protein